VTIIGALLNFDARCWLVWSSKPDNARYTNDSMPCPPASKHPRSFPRLCAINKRSVILVGNMFLLAGAVLAFLALAAAPVSTG
jgi:hypothetical protein